MSQCCMCVLPKTALGQRLECFYNLVQQIGTSHTCNCLMLYLTHQRHPLTAAGAMSTGQANLPA
jgi:hypothetical protein